ncbi:MAG: hypothetical protein CMK32_01365 [Porticoccaceae bacterium]|nr:hypothetical protein [Porticoccaceae bacterium]
MLKSTLALLTAVGLTLGTMPALADDHANAEKKRNCLSISRIDRIEVVDDNTLLFHMHGKEKYINKLPYRCAGLKSRGTFLHETSLQSYCDLDTITVIDPSLGMRLGSCPLGEFTPYVEEVKAE